MTESARRKTMLVVLDGWGLSPVTDGNATYLAKTPILDHIYGNYPKISITASGVEVGLSRGEMGNSEVGHLNLGTGRVVWESLPRIDQAIESGEFGKNEELTKTLEKAKSGKLHLIGITSSGGVHSHVNHLFAALDVAKKIGVKDACIHFISDGRDTPPKAALATAQQIEAKLKTIGLGRISTLIGRYYAMDRDSRWQRTEKAYRLMTEGKGKEFSSVLEAIKDSYDNQIFDEFIEPCVIDKTGLIEHGDTIIFYNFRVDRVRQLLEAFSSFEFNGFRRNKITPLNIATMTEYDARYGLPVIFKPTNLKNTFSDIISESGLKQFHTAETEKYPHVTYFFNGGVEKPHKNENDIVVPSPKVPTYDKKPEMSASGVSEKVISALSAKEDFILVNFANGDMVGHTGMLGASVKACEAIDSCLKKMLLKASENGYFVFLTADHGNCENMIDPITGEVNKEHTTNPVPFVSMDFLKKPLLFSNDILFKHEDLIKYSSEGPTGILADVASTILSVMEIAMPGEMIGTDLTKLMG
ncbi:MAG: 2,3-bisphosphoglycerate-independent phosphoglycerate mutase [Patescibacteria group bacterium]